MQILIRQFKELGATGIEQEKALKANLDVNARQFKKFTRKYFNAEILRSDVQSKLTIYRCMNLKTYYDDNKKSLDKAYSMDIFYL